MRIVLVNWARIADGASLGGGVNGYVQALAAELADRGHDVSYLSSGTTYVPASWSRKPGHCEVRQLNDFHSPSARPIRVFDVINSPVLAPGWFQFRDPSAEIRAPELERELARFFALLRPDIVHFHNIEGFSAGCPQAARASGASVLFSLHNYHTICPQVYLMQGGVTPCLCFDNGHACVSCAQRASAPMPREERAHRDLDHVQRHKPWLAGGLRLRLPILRQAAAEIASLVRPQGTPLPPGRDTRLAVRDAPTPQPGPPLDGLAAASAERPEARGHASASHAPLHNSIIPEPPSDKPPNHYAHRRHAMVGMLNACDRVLAVSSFVQHKFESLGVEPARLRLQHIGSRMTSIAAARPELLPDPPPLDPPHTIRLAFLGYHNYFKGLHVLADALDSLAPAHLARLDLRIHAKGVHPIEHRFRDLEPRLAHLAISNGYRYDDVPRLLSNVHAGLVPSVWWDNGPQTVMEFLACRVPVIASNIGGIPDFITHDRNGLLFTANDRVKLRGTLERIILDPALLPRLRTHISPPLSMRDHASDMERTYSEVRGL
jgi:glycosyltransferase involved in cell wall biosynthesis